MGDVGSILLLSLVAMFNPTLLAAVTIMMLLPKTKTLMFGYLLGAYLTSISLGMLVVFSLHHSGGAETARNTLSPAQDLTVGAILVIVGIALRTTRVEEMRERAGRAQGGQAARKRKSSRWPERLLGRGSARVSFAVGALLSFPGVSYLTALNRMSELEWAVAPTALFVVVFCLIQQLLLELPLIGYAVAPEWTQDAVVRFREWLGATAGARRDGGGGARRAADRARAGRAAGLSSRRLCSSVPNKGATACGLAPMAAARGAATVPGDDGPRRPRLETRLDRGDRRGGGRGAARGAASRSSAARAARSRTSTATTRSCSAAPSTRNGGAATPATSSAATSKALAAMPFWVFSSGPVGDPAEEDEKSAEWVEPRRTIAKVEELGARGHVVFGGRVPKEPKGMVEKAMAKNIPAEFQDRRDWDEIRAWARRIAAELDGAA